MIRPGMAKRFLTGFFTLCITGRLLVRLYHKPLPKRLQPLFSKKDPGDPGPWLLLKLRRALSGLWHHKIIKQDQSELVEWSLLPRIGIPGNRRINIARIQLDALSTNRHGTRAGRSDVDVVSSVGGGTIICHGLEGHV